MHIQAPFGGVFGVKMGEIGTMWFPSVNAITPGFISYESNCVEIGSPI